MKKILIVDDQTEIRELLQATLQMRGFRNLILASSGQEAVEKTLREKPDLIIMDVMMPGKMNGINATATLRKHPGLKNRPIVILSARFQKRDIDRGLEAGADDYWGKPFSPKELLDKVKGILKNPSRYMNAIKPVIKRCKNHAG